MSDFIPNPLQPISTSGMGQNPQSPIDYHTHNGIDSPLLAPTSTMLIDGNGGGTEDIFGQLTTTDAIPQTFFLTKLSPSESAILVSRTSCKDQANNLFGGFIRNATYKNNAGVVSVIDQIEDSYTMRNVSSWNVDYFVVANQIFIRVFGSASHIVVWKFLVSLVKS